MEQALQNYERTTQEAVVELRAVWEAERNALVLERQDLVEVRRVMELDHATMAAEIATVEGMVVRPDDRVLLNVGGKNFETTRHTLTAAATLAPYSLLGVMFSGRHESRLQPDGAGRVFIDRNAAMFEYILDFLRGYSMGDENTGFAIRALPNTQMAAMRVELDYYGLEDVVFPIVPYDVHKATFALAAEMLSKRNGVGSVVLPDERGVLVVGGNDGRKYLASTELYDLKTQTFAPGPTMGSKRWGCAAVVLEDGQVLVVGGNNGTSPLSSTEVLNPATVTWSPGPNMDAGRCGCAALPLRHGRTLVLGGARGSNARFSLASTEIVDLNTGTTAPGPEMSCPRYSFSAVLLPDDRVFVIGGSNSTSRSLLTTEVLDLHSGTSSPGPEMLTARRGAAVAVLPEEGGVLVIGGKDNDGKDLNTTEVLQVTRNTVAVGPVLRSPRSFCTAAMLPANCILVMGLGTSEILSMPAEER